MKLRLLKPLPWAREWMEFSDGDCNVVRIVDAEYTVHTLIQLWWAEEIKEPERWEPKLGERYYRYAIYTGGCNPIMECKSFESVLAAKKMAEYWLAAKTSEELETTLLLLKLRQSNGGWKPKDRENYFAVKINWYVSTLYYGINNCDRVNDLLTGNCYRTREEAEKYAPEWKKLFDRMK